MAEEQPGIVTQQQAPVPPPPSKRWWKWVKRIFWTLTIFIIFILVSAGCILYFFGDSIKQYAIDQLNTYLNTPVYIDPKNIDFTVLANFPNASVDFKDVKAMEVSDKEKKGTLFHAGSVSFQFNIMDVFHENYDIKKVTVDDVDLQLRVDRNGKDNYHFLKESKDTGSSRFDFALQEFTLKNVRVTYVNRKDKYDVGVLIKKGTLEGAFSSDDYSLSTDASLFVDHLKKDSTDYLTGKNVEVDLSLNVDNKAHLYAVNTGELKIEDLFLDVKGSLVHHEKDDVLDLNIQGKDMDIQAVLSLVPERYKQRIKDYSSEGDFYFNTTVKGTLSAGSTPLITSSFGIKQGEISQAGASVKLKNVNLGGKYFSGDPVSEGRKKAASSYLSLNNFSCTLGGGSISGSMMLTDLNDPMVDVKVNAGIGLKELQAFLRLDTIEAIAGDMKVNASFHGKIKEAKKYIAEDFRNTETSGEMSISGMNVKLKNNPLDLNNINGTFIFHNNDLGINSFTGNVSHSDFDLKGEFRNIMGWLFLEKEDLTVDATLHAKNIDLNELLADKESHSKVPSYKLRFPEYVDLNLNTSVDHVVFRKFEANSISGGIRIKDRKLIADPLTLHTMDGRITSSVMVDATNDEKVLITCDADLDHLNISKVFTEFENFGQEYLQDKHLRGIATAKVQLASVWSPELEIDPEKVYTLCDITIENGRLIGLQPLIDIAGDMRKDFVLNKLIDCDEFEKRLKSISFPAMSNHIEIKKQTITFQPMTLKSSALDMDFSGWHKFNNDIEYHFSFPFAALPLIKEKKRKEDNKEFGEEESESDGMVLYYTLTGNVDKEIFYKKDRTNKKIARKEKREEEKKNLKQILHDEFNWMFRKDTTLTNDKDKDKKKDPKKDDNKFIIKWDDEEKKDGKKEEDDF